MSQSVIHDLKSNLSVNRSILPGSTALSGSTPSNGTGVDTRDMTGPVQAIFTAGAVTGSPTTYSAACKLQESDDNSTFTDIASQRTLTLDANTLAGVVQGQHTKRYVRAVATPSFTGGSSPTLPVAAHVCGAKSRV